MYRELKIMWIPLFIWTLKQENWAVYVQTLTQP